MVWLSSSSAWEYGRRLETPPYNLYVMKKAVMDFGFYD